MATKMENGKYKLDICPHDTNSNHLDCSIYEEQPVPQLTTKDAYNLALYKRKHEVDLEIQQKKIQLATKNILDEALAKEAARQIISEKRKAQFEELVITSDGSVEIITRNLDVRAVPKIICNANHFHSVILVSSNEQEELLSITFEIDGKKKKIIIDPNKAFTRGYLLKKFNSGGIVFSLSRRKKRDVIEELFLRLFGNAQKRIKLPDHEGWIKNPVEPNRLIYVKESDWTWKKAKRLAQ